MKRKPFRVLARLIDGERYEKAGEEYASVHELMLLVQHVDVVFWAENENAADATFRFVYSNMDVMDGPIIVEIK